MAQTKIAWTGTLLPDGTWLPGYTHNPWIGCSKVSPACKHCYAEALVKRSPGLVLGVKEAKEHRGLPVWGDSAPRRRTSPANWQKVLKWNRDALTSGIRRKVFCASLADVFEDHDGLDEIRADLWPLIEHCTALDWLLLTKRPKSVLSMAPPKWWVGSSPNWPANVWIGTTVEDQAHAEERLPHLLRIPAPVRFVSYEPALGPVDFGAWMPICPLCRTPPGRCIHLHPRTPRSIDWLIIGGESGPGHRQMDLAAAEAVAQQCIAAGVALFVKQDSGLHAGMQGRISADLWQHKQHPQASR